MSRPPGVGDGALDVFAAAALGPVEPGAFGSLRGHSGQLTNDGPAEGASAKCLFELGQIGQGATHAQALFGLASAEPKGAFGVLSQAGVAEVAVNQQALG